jgi:chromosome partitioning protein
MQAGFEEWYKNSREKGKTIFHALDKFAIQKRKNSFTARGGFDFGIGPDFIYKVTPNLHFVPSHEQLYWLDLDVFDRSRVRHFIRALIYQISNTKGIDKYDYVLFDCPPSFTFLSYSVLAACDMALVPVNPDFFAANGIRMLLENLKLRMEPSPVPKAGVFMNKAKTWGDGYTADTEYYWHRIKETCEESAGKKGLNVRAFGSRIPERTSIKSAIRAYGVPADLVHPFKDLWLDIIQFLTYDRK